MSAPPGGGKPVLGLSGAEVVAFTAAAVVIGVLIGALLMQGGFVLAGVLVMVLPVSVMWGAIGIFRWARPSPWFGRRGHLVALSLILGGIGGTGLSIFLLLACAEGARCLAVDRIPLAVFLAPISLVWLATGYTLLARWAEDTERRRLQGALEGMQTALTIIWFFIEFVSVGWEAGLIALVVVLIVLFVVSFVLGVPFWLVVVGTVVLLVALGGAVGAIAGPSERIDPGSSTPPPPPVYAPPPPPAPPPPAAQTSAPLAAPAPPPAPAPRPPPPAPAFVPPPVWAPPFYPAAPGGPPPARCPRCQSPRIAYAPLPYRGLTCPQCGFSGPY